MARPPLLTRLRSMAARRHLDGRLPAPVSRLLRRWAALRARSTAARVSSRLLPPVGRARQGRRAGTVRRARADLRDRWVAGDLPCSHFDLAHLQAGTVVAALESAGLQPYLTGADDRRLSFGLGAEHRATAWRALDAMEPGGGWHLTWWRGARRSTVLLGERARPGTALRAERWIVHRLHRVAEGVVAGADEAVELTFWAPGPSGRREQLGVRGLQRHASGSPRTTEVVAGRPYPGIAAFPVGRAPGRVLDPIDVVYTWVDGSDPAWRAEFDRWSDRERPGQRGDHAVDPGRYRSRDELRWSLRSLWLHAGWVRRVFVVTADQVPPWLREDDRLRVVSHREIFPTDWLPTFNSHAIEARLHHIDGLAEQFLYLNDDMFLGRPVMPGQFFTGNGLSRFFPSGAWIPLEEDPGPALAVDTAARNGRRLVEATFGRTVDRKLHHAPYALRRSVLAEIEERFGDVVERTARSRFRHPDDLSIPSAFAHHYGFCTGRAVEDHLEVAYQNVENRRLGIFLERLLLGRDVDAFCLNETESAGVDLVAVDTVVTRFLDAYFPVPSPWEHPPG